MINNEIHKTKLTEILCRMVLIRRVEEALNDLFGRGELFGTSHLCIGQEAVAVGACINLLKGDIVASTHRGHGHALARGMDLKKLVAELLGKSEGICRGRGGTQHLSDLKSGFLGTNGITGGFIPVAVGAALSFKLKKAGNVAISFFGDGAANTGYFHESLNFASVKKLPVVFICENNLYGMSMHVKDSTSVRHIAQRAAAYSMPGAIVDGMNPLAVEEVVLKAIETARNGGGPSLIEAKTYRFLGHSKSDMRKYRSRDEEKEWRTKDPIDVFPKYLVSENILNNDEVTNLFSKIDEDVRNAMIWARSLPDPCPAEADDGLWS